MYSSTTISLQEQRLRPHHDHATKRSCRVCNRRLRMNAIPALALRRMCIVWRWFPMLCIQGKSAVQKICRDGLYVFCTTSKSTEVQNLDVKHNEQSWAVSFGNTEGRVLGQVLRSLFSILLCVCPFGVPLIKSKSRLIVSQSSMSSSSSSSGGLTVDRIDCGVPATPASLKSLIFFIPQP